MPPLWEVKEKDEPPLHAIVLSSNGGKHDGCTRCWLHPPLRASILISPRSTRSPKCHRKLTPMMGSAISARRKSHVNLLPPVATCILWVPHHAIGERSAVHKRGPDCGSLDL